MLSFLERQVGEFSEGLMWIVLVDTVGELRGLKWIVLVDTVGEFRGLKCLANMEGHGLVDQV